MFFSFKSSSNHYYGKWANFFSSKMPQASILFSYKSKMSSNVYEKYFEERIVFQICIIDFNRKCTHLSKVYS